MATLKINELEEVVINYHDLDGCGDILYVFQFMFDKKNVLNAEILSERNKDGVFIISDCDFEKCGLISFFEQVVDTKNSLNYENIEQPVIKIKCRAWNEFKDYRIAKWTNAKHHDGTRKYQEGSVESMLEYWEKEVELIFTIDSIFTINRECYSSISLHYATNTDVLRKFVDELKSEYQEFKRKNLEKHNLLSQ
jgi:hypothetical protein